MKMALTKKEKEGSVIEDSKQREEKYKMRREKHLLRWGPAGSLTGRFIYC